MCFGSWNIYCDSMGIWCLLISAEVTIVCPADGRGPVVQISRVLAKFTDRRIVVVACCKHNKTMCCDTQYVRIQHCSLPCLGNTIRVELELAVVELRVELFRRRLIFWRCQKACSVGRCSVGRYSTIEIHLETSAVCQ